MTIHVTCDACFMNYQLKDELAGRKVRCKQCQTVIDVPRPGVKPADLVDDPWVHDEDEPTEAPRAPARGRKKKKKRKSSPRESSSGFRLGVVGIVGIVFAVLFVLMCLVGLVVPPVRGVLGAGTALIGGGLMLVGGIGMLMAAFEEDVVCGVMYLVVPFYSLYYVLTRIGDVWKMLLMHIGGAAMLGFGMALYASMDIGTGAENDGGGLDFSFVDAQDEESRNNLQQIGLGMHNHHDTYSRFPPAPTEKSGGQLRVSWQTALLPFIDEGALFDRVNQTVPWDDPANDPVNRELIDRYLQFAVEETNDSRGYGLSHYALNQEFLGAEGGIRLRDVSDGTSNTVLSGEIGGGYKAWADPSNTRPVTGRLTPGPTTFGNPSGEGAYLLMADGAVRWVASSIDPTVLNAIGTRNGGEPPLDF